MQEANDNEWDCQIVGDEQPRLPDGEYSARFIRHETAYTFKTGKVFLWFEIVDPGPHFGARLYRPYRVRELIGKPGRNGRFKLARGSDLFKDLARLFSVQRRPDRISLQTLKGCIWRIRVRTVTHDYKQRPLPESIRYSVVSEILHAETEAGAVSS